MTVRSTESAAGAQPVEQRTWRSLITEPIVVVALITTTGSIIAAVIAAVVALQQYNRAEAAMVPTPTVTVTDSVTVTSTVTVRPGPTGQQPPPDDGGETTPSEPAGVFWAGQLTVGYGGFSLDVSPPRHVEGHSVEFSGGLHLFRVSEGMSLAEWTSNSVPSRDECAAAVAKHGVEDTGVMSASSQVCGKTMEGRIFLLEVVRIKDGEEVHADVTVWDK